MDDQQLVERCRRGNRDAQRELYERTCERIYGLLLKLTHNPDDAFDLTQETYLRAFARISQFEGNSSIATWLYRIAVNEGRQAARRGITGQRARESLGRIPQPGGNGQADTRLDVDVAMSELPEDDRLILLLRYHEGLDYETIAQMTELPPGTVASRLNRAREHLRERLKSYEQAEESSPPAHPIERQPERALGAPDLTARQPDAPDLKSP